MTSKLLQNVIKDLKSREERGINKYNTTMDRSDLTLRDWLVHQYEELLDAASNRYRITVQVANKAKRQRYEDLNLIDDFKFKPVIRAILEIAEEISRPEILNE